MTIGALGTSISRCETVTLFNVARQLALIVNKVPADFVGPSSSPNGVCHDSLRQVTSLSRTNL